MPKFSLIVLSKTDTQSNFNMNLNCFNTFIESAKRANIDYELLLIESNKESKHNYHLKYLKIIKPEENFNFHKFLNIGVTNASGDFYILSNNDVVFNENWLSELIFVSNKKPKIESFSPFDKNSNKLPKQLIENHTYIEGYEIQKHLTGWCLVIRKSVFKTIKKLDERFNFYYADNDYSMQLQKYNIRHALITKAIVHHLGKDNGDLKKRILIANLPNRTPKYVIRENWTWVLNNPKMIEGLITFHDKWGSRRVIKMKLLIANFFLKLGLGYFNRFVIYNK
jgi:GT2 family glycosyltransferase